jgi:hypothetical protein
MASGTGGIAVVPIELRPGRLLTVTEAIDQKEIQHLVANILIFMEVHDQSRIMNQLIQEGHVITREKAAGPAPFRKPNINRFGAYFLDELRKY